MAKLTLNNVTTGYQSATATDANNDLIEAAVENTLSRDGTSPNQMAADLDMNSNAILNAAAVQAASLVVAGEPWPPGAVFTNSDAAPDPPIAGQFWYKTTTGRLYLYYADADSSQWVEVGGFFSTTAPADSSAVPYTHPGISAVATTVQTVLQRTVTPYDFGATADDSTDDSAAFNAMFVAAKTYDHKVYIPYGTYYCASQIAITGAIHVTSHPSATIRWDGIAANVGFKIQNSVTTSAIQNCTMEFPVLRGPVYTAWNDALPGYSTNTQVGTDRVGNAINFIGGNRVSLKVHIANGFENAFLIQTTATLACDNLNIEAQTSDFCINFLHLDSSAGKGMAAIGVNANTVWAKTPIRLDTSAGYISGKKAKIKGVTYVSEDGGCGVYVNGTGVRSSSFYFNQLQAGYRGDSHTSTAILLSPPGGTWAALPVAGDTITQATSGATGTVVTNADYTISSTTPITVESVSGTFDITNSCTATTNGTIGIPASVRGLVCPWLAGDQTSNSLSYDGEQTGTLAYAGTTHCNFTFGAPMDFAGGTSMLPPSYNGAQSMYPQPGESVRIRDAGVHNNIQVINAAAEADDASLTAVTLSSTVGEENFNGGVGSAAFADWVYCYISANSLADGSKLTRYLYHTQLSTNTTLVPVQVIPKNTGGSDRNAEIAIIAYANNTTDNRRIQVELFNTSGSALETTQDVYFYVKVGR